MPVTACTIAIFLNGEKLLNQSKESTLYVAQKVSFIEAHE
jgi:hypothetical protein